MPDVVLLDVETGETERLTESEANEISPAWSPDGGYIAFTSDRSNPDAHENEIYVMTSVGDGVRRITDNSVSDHTPAWRPS